MREDRGGGFSVSLLKLGTRIAGSYASNELHTCSYLARPRSQVFLIFLWYEKPGEVRRSLKGEELYFFCGPLSPCHSRGVYFMYIMLESNLFYLFYILIFFKILKIKIFFYKITNLKIRKLNFIIILYFKIL